MLTRDALAQLSNTSSEIRRLLPYERAIMRKTHATSVLRRCRLALLVEHRLMTVLGDIGVVEDLLPPPRPSRPESARREVIRP